MNTLLAKRLGLCLISGLVVGWIQQTDFAGWTPYLTSGLAFAAGVLFPYLQRNRQMWLRALGLVAVSSLSYYVAVLLALDGPFANDNEWISFTLASVAGAAIVIVPAVFLAPIRASNRLFALGLAAGLIGGPVTNSTLPQETALILIGHVTWHALICMALLFGTYGSSNRASGSLR